MAKAIDMTKAQDYGIKIAQPNFDARTAGDYQLLFNSSWPSLAVAYTTTITIGPNLTGTVSHNLGFPAFTRVYQILNGVGTVITNGVNGSNTFIFDNNTVTITNWDASNTMTFNVVVYNLDISKGVKYKLLTPPANKVPYNPDYGIKIPKPGKSLTSKDLRDFTLHTRAQSPAVLSVLTQDDSTDGFTIPFTNPGNYTAWIFGFWMGVTLGNTWWQPTDMYTQAEPGIYINTDGVTFRLQGTFPDNKAALVVLRDPLFTPNIVNVVY